MLDIFDIPRAGDDRAVNSNTAGAADRRDGPDATWASRRWKRGDTSIRLVRGERARVTARTGRWWAVCWG